MKTKADKLSATSRFFTKALTVKYMIVIGVLAFYTMFTGYAGGNLVMREYGVWGLAAIAVYALTNNLDFWISMGRSVPKLLETAVGAAVTGSAGGVVSNMASTLFDNAPTPPVTKTVKTVEVTKKYNGEE